MWVTLTGVLAKLTASSWMTWLAAFVPGGQIVGVLGSIVGLIGKVIKAVIDGITVSIANPVVFTIVGIAFAGGLYEGVRWDKHKIEAANARTAALEKKWKDDLADQTRRLNDANAARIAAEEASKAIEGNAAARAAAGSSAARQRVRTKPTPAAAQPGSSLLPQWFPPVFGKN